LQSHHSYMHVRELEHRKVTEKTFSDILFWTLLEVTVVLLLVRGAAFALCLSGGNRRPTSCASNSAAHAFHRATHSRIAPHCCTFDVKAFGQVMYFRTFLEKKQASRW
jgi:hypothetical protein